MKHITSTRRTMLGVLAVAPIAAAAAASAATPSPADSWEALHTRWLAACDAQAAAEAHYLTTAYDTPACERASAACERAMAELNAVVDRLLTMPSPHGRALLWKIEYALRNDEDEGGCIAWSYDHIAPVVEDARRMLGGVRS